MVEEVEHQLPLTEWNKRAWISVFGNFAIEFAAAEINFAHYYFFRAISLFVVFHIRARLLGYL